jgi:hypothetical protein
VNGLKNAAANPAAEPTKGIAAPVIESYPMKSQDLFPVYECNDDG